MSKPTIFISYSHKDEEWKDRLVAQLGVLRYEGLIEIWDDRLIGAGEDWLQHIRDAMNRASIAVLLVSADFLTSEFILDIEAPHLLERRDREGIRIFPIIVRPCLWRNVEWLARMNARPKDGTPLSVGNEQQIETNLVAIAGEIAALIKNEFPSPTFTRDETTPHAPARRTTPPTFDFKRKAALVDALLACPAMSDRSKRDVVVNDLPDDIEGNINRGNAARTDVMGIVTTCLNYPNGLRDLIEIVRYHEGDSISMRNVDELISRVD